MDNINSNVMVEQNFKILNDMKKDLIQGKASISPAPWPNTKSLTLIELYKERPSLWDPCNSKYRDKKSRRDSLIEISRAIGGSVEDVERKIHGLRTQFLRECRRHYENSTWFAYEPMKFLLDIRNAKLEIKEEKVVYKVLLINNE